MTDQQNIAEIDKTLAILRESWLEAKDKDKAKWMDRINTILETRSIYMKSRDKATKHP